MFILRSRRWSLFTSLLCFIGGCSIGSWVTTIFYQVQLESDSSLMKSPGHVVNGEESEYHLSPGAGPGENTEDEEYEIDGRPHLLLALLIVSAPRNFQQRETLRSTWLKLTPASSIDYCKHYFIIGTEGIKQELQTKLEQEQLRENDLILLSDLKDIYLNLTAKLVMGITYLTTHMPFHYLLKCDDDSFVRVDILIQELEERQKKLQLQLNSTKNALILRLHRQPCYYWGFFDGRARAQSAGKWKEPDYNLCDLYIPYALGGGYILSKDCAQFIVKNRNVLKHFINEDVSVGTWLSVISPERRHDTRFDTEYESRGCSNKYIVQHKISQIEMIERYHSLITDGRLCLKEYRRRASYNYDWNIVPSKCCKRNSSVI